MPPLGLVGASTFESVLSVEVVVVPDEVDEVDTKSGLTLVRPVNPFVVAIVHASIKFV